MSINRDEYLFISYLRNGHQKHLHSDVCCTNAAQRIDVTIPLGNLESYRYYTQLNEICSDSVGMMGDNGAMTPQDIIILCLLYEKTKKKLTNRCLFRWDSLSLLLHFRSM